MMRTMLLFFYIGCFSILFAKLPIAVSSDTASFVLDNPKLSTLLSAYPQENETEVRNLFLEHNIKLAIVRSDLLREIFLAGKQNNTTPYHIIGKVPGKSILYFATKEHNATTISLVLAHKRISIGVLGDGADRYLSHVLKEEALSYSTNFLSYDPYRSIKELKKGHIDGLFLFSSQDFSKRFSQYLTPYPDKLKEILEESSSLVCRKSTYCYASYYLIASDTIGKGVMENIYLLAKPFLSKNKTLTAQLGKHYIPTGIRAKPIVVQTHIPTTQEPKDLPTRNKPNTPSFHRTPWMDLAIAEAIHGRGTAENVLPMLDLSYKYIRFAKGNSGITTAPNDNREGSWCAAYVCWTLGKSGYKIHKSGRMASQSFRYFNNKLYKKIDQPIFGAITVYTNMRNPAHGHVGYLFGKTKRGRYILLGGNQSNRLKFADYAAHFGSYALRGFYIPMGYVIKEEDRLTNKDIYPSASFLNRKYGITGGGKKRSVR